MAFKSQQELYDLFVTELQSRAPQLTDVNEGSINDVLAGVVSVAVSEIQQTVIDEFKKTFIETANGPEVTGSEDDLERLAVDRFGETFARPEASKSTGTVTFSRPNTGAGNVSIVAGTIVKTPANATGNSQRFEVVSTVVLTGLTINASVRAVVAGSDGNVAANQVTQIETALTDSSVTVNNSNSFTGGAPAETDSQYRETIRSLIRALSGATIQAIQAKALTVPGVEKATGLEFLISCKEWDPVGNVAVGDVFRIPRARLYIADANGTASGTLLNDVRTAIASVRAAGVLVDVIAAIASALNWTATLTLNPSGPNYSSLSANASPIVNAMVSYLQSLNVGQGFDRAAGRGYIMSIWGPSGTNDLTDFVTNTPTGNVAVAANEKIVPGTVAV